MLKGTSLADPVVIVAAVRTPVGRYGGVLSMVDAHELGALCIREALVRAGVAGDQVDEVVLGQVGQVGPDAYNARRAARAAGLPTTTTALNVNRLCGSGLEAILEGVRRLLLGEAGVVVAGGNESMSRQPFLDYGARRTGWRLGDRELVDGTLSLVTDPFGRYPMGVTAENVATRFGVERAAQDAFAIESQQRAASAIAAGLFDGEIVGVTIGDDPPITRDEHPRADATIERLSAMRPAFVENGTVTAGNSSGINDGAAAVVLMRESEARRRGLRARARVRAWAVTGIEPEIMGYAPAQAIPAVLACADLSLDDIDLIELNEAFAAQAVAVMRDVDLDRDRVNVMGGAIALGHPVGATGAILVTRIVHALERTAGRYGLVAMCIGGGQGIAAILERP